MGNHFHHLHRDFLVNYLYINSIIRPLSTFMLCLPEWKAANSRTGLSCRPASQLPGAPNYTGLQEHAGIIADMALVNSGFDMKKNFFRKLSSWARANQNICQPYPWPNFSECSECAQISSRTWWRMATWKQNGFLFDIRKQWAKN